MEQVVLKLDLRIDNILTFLQQYFLDEGSNYSICVEDLIEAVERYDKNECLDENYGILAKREKVFIDEKQKNS